MNSDHGKHERKAARRGLRTRVDLELSEHLFWCNDDMPAIWDEDYYGWISA